MDLFHGTNRTGSLIRNRNKDEIVLIILYIHQECAVLPSAKRWGLVLDSPLHLSPEIASRLLPYQLIISHPHLRPHVHELIFLPYSEIGLNYSVAIVKTVIAVFVIRLLCVLLKNISWSLRNASIRDTPNVIVGFDFFSKTGAALQTS